MPDPFLDNWATQLRKGMLELAILNAVSTGRMYGYDIVKTLRDVDGLMISEGTIYPILSRLKRENLLAATIEESAEGPARKYYRLTPEGKKQLARMNTTWAAVRAGIESLQQGD